MKEIPREVIVEFDNLLKTIALPGEMHGHYKSRVGWSLTPKKYHIQFFLQKK